MPTTYAARPSGKTPAGKAISARNATTHGLFCRQTVLPHLGEDPAAYQRVLDTLQEQLRPRNLMEHQYLELFADASWKLRRLSRLEAQVWEDDRLDEDARLTKMERLYRLQVGLRRQLDKSVRMLSQDVPNLFAHRTREDVLAKLSLTESLCAQSEYRERTVEEAVQANRHWPAPGEGFTDGLDNVPPPPAAPTHRAPADPFGSPNIGVGGGFEGGAGDPSEYCDNKNCQNELAPVSPSSPWQGEVARNEPEGVLRPKGVLTPQEDEPQQDDPEEDIPAAAAPLSWREQRRQELQAMEDLLNSGTLTKEERRAMLLSIGMNKDIPGYSVADGRVKIHHK